MIQAAVITDDNNESVFQAFYMFAYKKQKSKLYLSKQIETLNDEKHHLLMLIMALSPTPMTTMQDQLRSGHWLLHIYRAVNMVHEQT